MTRSLPGARSRILPVSYPATVVARILVVEDDDVIGVNLVRALSAEGWDAERVATGEAALRLLDRSQFDLILLDLGLPDIDGIELCGLLRDRARDATVVMLSARVAEIEVVVGLDAGADDYITKPFRLAELLARLRAHLRRASNNGSGSATLAAGDVTVEVAARRAWVGDEELDLRRKEFDLLVYLVRARGQVVRREQIMADVWDQNWWGSTKTLDIHIAALRRKLGEQSDETSRIATLRGVGYRFEGR
jgi:DNA-binding response OmpR family regulator